MKMVPLQEAEFCTVH